MSDVDMSLGHVTAVTQADNSQFDSSMKKSEEVATATATQIKKAKEAEAKAIALNAKLAATAVTEQTTRIVLAYNAEIAASKDLRAARDLAKDMNDREAAVQLTAKAYQQLTAAKLASAAAAAEVSVLTQRSAVSAVVRATEGQQGIRAVEGFLTMLPGVGAALQDIFPLVGAGMFAALIGKMGMEMYAFEQKAAHAAEATKDAFAVLHDKAQTNIDDLAVENDKLDEQIAKLNGKPGDGLQLALDQARKNADRLLDSLDEDQKALDGLLKAHSVGLIASAVSGVAPSGRQEKEMLADQRDLTRQVRAAKAAYDDSLDRTKGIADPKARAAAVEQATNAHSGAVAAVFQKQIEAYNKEALRLTKEQFDTPALSNRGDESSIDNSKKIATIQGRIQQLNDAFKVERMSEDQDAKRVVADTTPKVPKPPKEKKEKPESYHHLFDYEAQARENAAISESLLKTWTALNRQDEEAAKIKAEGQAKVDEAARKAAEVNRRYADSLAGVDSATAKAVLAMNEMKTQHQLAIAAISRPEALDQIAAQHKVAYQAELDANARERAALTPEDEANGKGNDLEAKRIAIQAELDRTMQSDAWAKFESTALGGATAALQDFARNATDASAQIKSFLAGSIDDVNGGLVKMLTEPNWQHKGEWGGIGHNIATSATGSLLRGAEGSVLKGLGIGKVDGSSETNALWVKMARIGGAVGGGISKDVASAAGKLGGWGGSILHSLHIPGFAVGTNEIPRDMLAMVHKGEAIVPAAYNPAVGGAGGGGFNPTIHVYGNGDPAQVRAQVMQGLRQFAPQIVSASVSAIDNRRARNPSGKY